MNNTIQVLSISDFSFMDVESSMFLIGPYSFERVNFHGLNILKQNVLA